MPPFEQLVALPARQQSGIDQAVREAFRIGEIYLIAEAVPLGESLSQAVMIDKTTVADQFQQLFRVDIGHAMTGEPPLHLKGCAIICEAARITLAAIVRKGLFYSNWKIKQNYARAVVDCIKSRQCQFGPRSRSCQAIPQS